MALILEQGFRVGLTEEILLQYMDIQVQGQSFPMPTQPFKFEPFESLEAMKDYTSQDRYIYDDDIPGVCFGFALEKDDDGNYNLDMFWNDGPYVPEQ